MKTRTLLAAAAALALVASGTLMGAQPARKVAMAEIKNAKGEKIGDAKFKEGKGSVEMSVKVMNLTEGIHAIHIHEVGKCEAPDFKSAGPHFNPTGKQHGHKNPQGAHAGDLPNLTVGKDGKGKATYTAKGVTLGEGPGSLLGPEGTALVIHADPDDERSDPAGNAGARIACGVVEKH